MINFNKENFNKLNSKERQYKGFYGEESDDLRRSEKEGIYDAEELEKVEKRTSAEVLFERIQKGYKPDLYALDWLEGFDEDARDLSETVKQLIHSDNPEEVLQGVASLVMIDAAMYVVKRGKRDINFKRDLKKEFPTSSSLQNIESEIEEEEKYAEKKYKEFMSDAESYAAGDKEVFRSSSKKAK